MGGPAENRETIEESLSFADSLELDSFKITVGIRIYPEIELAATARTEGIIRADDDLLQPAFYITPRLKAWLPKGVAAYTGHN